VELFNVLADDINSLIANRNISEALSKLEEFRKLRAFGDNHSYYEIIKKLSIYCIRNTVIDHHSLTIVQQNALAWFHSCDISVDGSKVFFADSGSVNLWDIAQGRCIRTFEPGMQNIRSFCLNSDDSKVLIGGAAFVGQSGKAFRLDSGETSSSLQLWDVNTGTCTCSFNEHTEIIDTVRFNSDGSKAISGGSSHTIMLWDTDNGNCIRIFEGHKAPVSSVCFSPDEKMILSVSSYSAIKLWDTNTGECLSTFILQPPADSWGVCLACFSPDGRKILSYEGITGAIKLWDVASGECIRTFEKKGKGLFINLSPDGSKILFGVDNDIELLDITTGDCIYTFKGHTSYIRSFCFSSDGLKIVSASDKGILVHDLDYDLTFPGWHDWDEGARPYLDIFLTLHPNWTEDDFNNILIPDLQNRGYGWLRPEGVRIKLDELQFGW